MAHALVLTSVLGGCALSHGQDGVAGFDAGPRDAGFDSGWDGGIPDRGRPDAGPVDAGPPDSGPIDSGPPDGGPPDGGPLSCAPQDAVEEPCNDVICDGLDSWYWDGGACFPVACGTCSGDDCGFGFDSRGACEAAHAPCEAQLCTDTGGEWRWWDEVCGHYRCGFTAPSDCEVGGPACDCGFDERFEEGVGCVPTECGDWDADPEVLCTTTGGEWGNICCDTVCGEFCPEPCEALACACGADEVFHPIRGCERATQCMERSVGQTCTPGARCEDGSVCCESCGGAGCFGPATCRLPTCDDDLDLCGNDPDAP